MEKKKRILHGLSLKVLTLLTVITLFCGLFTLLTNRKTANAEEATHAVEYVLGVASVTDTENGFDYTPATSTVPAKYTYKDHAAGWTAAYEKASELYTAKARIKEVRVTIASDWVAGDNANYTTAFGSGKGFSSGRLYLADNVLITLDLAGNKIDRHLTDGVSAGHVVRIDTGAKLVVTDTSTDKNGEITGGCNNASGAGVYVNGGMFVLDAGKITNNKIKTTGSGSGAGIFTSGTASITINGGEVSDNTVEVGGSCYGAGIYSVYDFKMTGGKITRNKSIIGSETTNGAYSLGGGVAAWGGFFLMSGGEISENVIETTKENATFGLVGGGIAVYSARVSIGGDSKIRNNEVHFFGITSNPNGGGCSGGGIILYGVSGTTLDLYGNAEIFGNKTLKKRNITNAEGNIIGSENVIDGTYAGGVFVNSPAVFNMSGGKIYDNESGEGAGVVNGGTINLSGGEISGNRAIYASGIYTMAYTSSGRCNISGNPVVKDNICYSNAKYAYGLATTDKNGKAGYYSNMIIHSGFLGKDKYALTSTNKTTFPPYTVSSTTVNNKTTEYADFPNYHLKITGKLTEGADIHFSTGSNTAMKGENEYFAWNYSTNNYTQKTVGGVTYKVPVDPNTYFHADRGETSKVVLASNGTLVETTKNIVFSAKHAVADDTADQTVQSGYIFETTYAKDNKLFATVKNGENALIGQFVNASGTPITTDLVNAGVYYYRATVVDGLTVQYTLVIKPQELTKTNTEVVLEGVDALEYDGTQKTPAVTSLKHKEGEVETTLVLNTDYNAPVYGANVNAGEGTVEVTFKGNYYGKVVYTFTINKKSGNYTVVWEYKDPQDTDRWNQFTSESTPFFTYDASDYSAKVRARLTVQNVSGVDEKVYAVTKSTTNITNMYLTISGTFESTAVDKLINATTYTITIAGDPNYAFANATDKSVTLRIKQSNLDLSANNFKDITEDTTNLNKVLWLKKVGENSTRLLDKPTYFDPNATSGSVYGEKVVQGELYNSYIRYDGNAHVIELNKAYAIGTKTLNDYMTAIKEISYVNKIGETVQTGNITGTVETVTTVTTTATLTLNSNYLLTAGQNTISFSKVWYIVTINNRIVDALGREVNTLENWTFGDKFTGVPFMPEHGNAVIYTLSNATDVLQRFAVEFDGTTPYFYEVKEVKAATRAATEVYTIDKTKQITDANYYVNLMNNLEAGSYTLNAVVEKYESGGTVYYPISRSYNFVVERFAIRDNTEDSGLSVVYGNSVAYNGKANNLPSIIVKFKNVTLEKGVDYEVVSENVNVGNASFKVKGLGNFAGEVLFENSYAIAKANNTWKSVPAVVSWVFSTYEPRVNTMSATPTLLDAGQTVWYKVTSDLEGTHPLTGLEKFVLNADGFVPNEVAVAFNALLSGKYYLHAVVDGNDNYSTLTNGVAFDIFIAQNEWQVTPGLISWEYNKYSKDTNVVLAKSRFGEITFAVATDAEGQNLVEGLTAFTTTSSGVVNETVAAVLASLQPNTYYLVCKVANTTFYSALNSSVEFVVSVAKNDWNKTPEVIAWNFESYDINVHRILATAVYGTVTFAVATDEKGTSLVAGLESFSVDAKTGLVPTAVANKLNALKVGKYYLVSKVAAGTTYDGLTPNPISFNVSKANNEWLSGSDELQLPSWVVGRYSAEANPIVIKARYGEVAVVIEDVDGNIYYNSATGENKLNDCKIGKYLLKAWVVGGENYNELTERTFTIEVLKKVGLPWWGTLSITLGALALAALIIFILWKQGVFQILTGKIVVAIRTRASIDATIASVRAAKKMEEGRRTVAEAERRDAEEKAKAEAEKAKAEEKPQVKQEAKAEQPKKDGENK